MPAWFWPQQLYGIPITFLFIFIVGISLALSASKTKDAKILTKKLIKRGAFIFAVGLLITAVTFIYPHDGAILFGVLHLIGVSTILAVPFLIGGTKEVQFLGKNKNSALILISLVAGTIVIAFSKIVEKTSGSIWLVPLGIHPYGFYTLDYEPLFPWFGFVLLGIAVGFWLYPKGERRGFLKFLKNEPAFVKGISFIGRHSLLIYLGHQPVILAGIIISS